VGGAAGFSPKFHVEAHVAAQMRRDGLEHCVLYVDRPVCPFDRTDKDPANKDKWPQSCNALLERMLAPGARLVVYGPDRFCKIYEGRSEEEWR
jgi:hypothetical protein